METEKKYFNPDSSPGVSLECFNLFGMSQKLFSSGE